MLRFIIAVLGVFLVGWTVQSPPAHAEMVCGDRAEALVRLERAYSEAPTAMGLSSSGAVVEVFTSKNGTFTIIMTQPSGISCLVISGDSWENLPARLAGIKS